jgi:hypothetical protein
VGVLGTAATEKRAKNQPQMGCPDLAGSPNHRRRKQYSKRLTETDVVLLVNQRPPAAYGLRVRD